MKKLVVMMALIAASVSFASAQGRFSVGAELGLPMGDFGDISGLGIGGTVRYESAINENLNWMGTAGYISFAEKDDYGVKVSIIPIQAGLKYYFNESFNGFYGGAQIGFNIVKAKTDFLGESVSASDTEFGFAPEIGYHLSVIDISARYQVISDADYVGFRIAYVFGGE
jgi:hypothetical protein